jgi:hypothetical protein
MMQPGRSTTSHPFYDRGYGNRLPGIHISPVGRSFLPALQLGKPQADVRRLGCRDLRQSAAFKKRLFRRNVSYNKGPLTRVHTSKPAPADWLLALLKTPADMI